MHFSTTKSQKICIHSMFLCVFLVPIFISIVEFFEFTNCFDWFSGKNQKKKYENWELESFQIKLMNICWESSQKKNEKKNHVFDDFDEETTQIHYTKIEHFTMNLTKCWMSCCCVEIMTFFINFELKLLIYSMFVSWIQRNIPRKAISFWIFTNLLKFRFVCEMCDNEFLFVTFTA